MLLSKWGAVVVPDLICDWKPCFLKHRHTEDDDRLYCIKVGLTPSRHTSKNPIWPREFKRMISDMVSELPIYKYVDNALCIETGKQQQASARLQSTADNTETCRQENKC